MHVVSQNSSNMTASESTDDDSEFNQIRVRQIVKKIIYGVKFIWISTWQFGSYDDFCDSRMVITSILVSFNFLSFFARISTGS